MWGLGAGMGTPGGRQVASSRAGDTEIQEEALGAAGRWRHSYILTCHGQKKQAMVSNSRSKSTHRAGASKVQDWCAAGGYMRSRRSKWVLWTLAACGNQFVLNTRHLASCHISRFSVSAHFPLMMSSGKCKKNIRAGKLGRMIILSWLLKIFRKHLPSSAQCSLCRIHHDQPSIAARSYKGAESWPH